MPRKLTTSEYIEKAKKAHGDKYDYSNVTYISSQTKIEIVCAVHGPFFQTPNSHLTGCECPICGEENGRKSNRLTTADFIARARKIHFDAYDYSLVKYTVNSEPVTIICKLHGKFEQNAYAHIHPSKMSGCPACSRKGYSSKALVWIKSQPKSHLIQHALNGGEFKIPGTRFKADGYCKQTNTIYEFYGDVFHGNPRLFKPHDLCHPFNKTTAAELLERTQNREAKIKKLGYNIKVMWEDQFDKGLR